VCVCVVNFDHDCTPITSYGKHQKSTPAKTDEQQSTRSECARSECTPSRWCTRGPHQQTTEFSQQHSEQQHTKSKSLFQLSFNAKMPETVRSSLLHQHRPSLRPELSVHRAQLGQLSEQCLLSTELTAQSSDIIAAPASSEGIALSFCFLTCSAIMRLSMAALPRWTATDISFKNLSLKLPSAHRWDTA
jgi:hypothetical protein